MQPAIARQNVSCRLPTAATRSQRIASRVRVLARFDKGARGRDLMHHRSGRGRGRCVGDACDSCELRAPLRPRRCSCGFGRHCGWPPSSNRVWSRHKRQGLGLRGIPLSRPHWHRSGRHDRIALACSRPRPGVSLHLPTYRWTLGTQLFENVKRHVHMGPVDPRAHLDRKAPVLQRRSLLPVGIHLLGFALERTRLGAGPNISVSVAV